ncbi:MAG: TlpA family protein disulfide reductase [Calditrichae bacterium]|nr:TlpA family protein disulfide reductase [Calditrichota bacterium]MCB9057979.1 TlpA family protein disulfide reductase [Calditrichia bacterium]
MIARLSLFLLLLFSFSHASDLTGKQAPLFKGTDLDGKEINLTDYRGKIVLLDFWASWCGPCQQELPFLVDLYSDHQNDDFVVLAVNIDNEKENMMRFLKKKYATRVFPVIFDSEKAIPPLYDLQAMPTSFFIDKKGMIRFTHTGFKDSDKKQFTEELTTLLREK